MQARRTKIGHPSRDTSIFLRYNSSARVPVSSAPPLVMRSCYDDGYNMSLRTRLPDTGPLHPRGWVALTGYVRADCNPEGKADQKQDAITALNTLQSNFSVVDAIRKSGGSMNKQAIPEMIEWCRKVGYEVGCSGMATWSMDSRLNGWCSRQTLIA